MRLARKIRKSLRRTWMNYALRGVGGNDNHERLDLAYQLSDPWNMESELEQFRFERTNTIIRDQVPAAQSLLEIGCGEGHQTEHLQRICPVIYGIDVSAIAVGRAQARLPAVHFATGDLFAQPWGRQRHRFDLVLACEVLYYIKEPQRTIEEMTYLGKTCLMTIFAPAAYRIGPILEHIPHLRKDWFGRREAQWLVAWWPGSQP